MIVTDGRGRRVRDFGLARWLERAAPPAARGMLSIALVGETEMRRLNRTFRGKDTTTDVLSFPGGGRGAGGRRPRRVPLRAGLRRRVAGVLDGAPGPPPPAAGLGDLAICLRVAGRQARAFGHPLRIELRILALHGVLHLLGYDHETDSGTMRRLEDRLRRRARLPTGLVARAQASRPASESGR